MGYDYVTKVAKYRTLKRNQNYMLCITGPTGSGKSYTAMAISLMIDDTFNVDRVTFRAKDFIEASNKDLPEGSVIMFDEAGIDVSSRDWQSKTNEAINKVVETFRRDNLVCVFTTPVFGNLDKKTRHYFHAHMEVLDPSVAGWGACKYFNIIVDANTGDIIRPYPKIKDDQGRTVKMKGEHGGKPNMKFPDPRKMDKQLVDNYEEKKKEFTEKVKRKGLYELKRKENKINWEIDDIAGHLAHNPDEFEIDQNTSTSKLKSRYYTKLKNMFDDIEVSRRDVGDAIEYIKSSQEESQKITQDPLADKKSKGDYDLEFLDRDKHLELIREWRLKGELTYQEMANRLGMAVGRFSTQYRQKFPDVEEDYDKMKRKEKEEE